MRIRWYCKYCKPGVEPKIPCRGCTPEDREFVQRRNDAFSSKFKESCEEFEKRWSDNKRLLDLLLARMVEDSGRKSSKIAREELFDGYDLGELVKEFRIRVEQIDDPNRQRQVVNEVIKEMRRIGVRCEQMERVG